MPIVPKKAWTPGETVLASDLTGSHRVVRDHINSKISRDDFVSGTFDTEALQRGEPQVAVDDHIFPSGDHFMSRLAKSRLNAAEGRWYTATVKSHDPQKTTRYVSHPDLGKQFYMEAQGYVLVHASFYAEDLPNDQYLAIPARGSETSSRFMETEWYLATDGTVDNETRAYSFEETTSRSNTGTPQSILSGSLVNGFQQVRKRVYLMDYQLLNRGWHNIQVVCNPNNNAGYIGMFNLTIEILYEGGVSSGDPTAQTLKFPVTNF